MRMWNIKYLVRDLIYTRDLQQWLNNRYRNEDVLRFDIDLIKSLTTIDDITFNISNDIVTVEHVYHDYKFDGINKSDIVLDIGANIGAFSLLAAKKSDHVFAIEPVQAAELKKNIELNDANIEIIEIALGPGEPRAIKWGGKEVTVETKMLSDIIEMCGGCDFLKCDCEGGEYVISGDELENIRRIEMECHPYMAPDGEDGILFEERLQKYFDFVVDVPRHPFHMDGNKHKTYIIHAKNKNISSL